MSTWKRRALIALLVLMALVIVGPLLLIGSLQHQGLRMSVVDRVLDTVNDDLRGTISVGAVEGSLLGHLRVQDVKIFDGYGDLAADVDTAEVHFSLLALASRSIQVQSLELTGATAVVRTHPDGTLNWITLVDEDEEAPPTEEELFDWPIDVHHIAIDGVSLAYLDEALPTDPWEGLESWRSQRASELGDARHADDIAQTFGAAFDEDHHKPFAIPRAPTAAWLDDANASARFSMRGTDIAVTLDQLSAGLQSDIISEALSVSVNDTDMTFDINDGFLDLALASLRIDEWAHLQQAEFEIDLIEVGDDEMPFEYLQVVAPDLSLEPTLLHWATLGELPIDQALNASTNARLTPDELSADLELSSPLSTEAIVADVELRDYLDDELSYDISVRAPEFQLDHWLTLDDLPPIATSLSLDASGQGIDPNTLRSDIQAQVGTTLIDGNPELHSLDLALEVDKGRLTIATLEALSPYIDASANGFVDAEGSLALNLQSSTPEEAHPDLPTPEEASFDLDLQAQWSEALDLADPPDDPLFFVEQLDTLDLSAQWDFRQFALDPELFELRIDASSGDASMDARSHGPSTSPSLSVDYDLDATAQGVSMPDLQLAGARIADRGSLEFEPLSDEPLDALDSLRQQGSLSVQGLRTPDMSLANASADFRLTPAGSESGRLRATTHLRDLRSGPTHLGNLQATLDVDLRFGHPELFVDSGDIDLDATLNNLRLDDLHLPETTATARGSFELGDLNTPLRRTQVHLSLDTQSATSPDLELRGAQGRFDADVELGPATEPMDMVRRLLLKGELTLDSLDLPGADLHAEKIALETDLSGTPRSPRGSINAAVQTLTLGGEPLDDTTAAIDFQRDHHHLALAVSQRDGPSLAVGADFHTHDDLGGLDLLSLTLETDELHWQTDADAHLHLRPDRIEATAFRLGDDRNHLGLHGHFAPTVDQDLQVSAALDFAELMSGFYLDFFLDDLPDIDGQLEAQVDLTGTHRRPTLTSVVELMDTTVDGEGPFAATLDVDYDDERLTLRDLNLRAFDEDIAELHAEIPVSLELDGNWALHLDRPSSASAQLWPLQLRDFHEPLPILNDLGIDGHIQGTLNWQGTLADPQLDLRAQLQSLQAQGQLNDDFIDFRDVDLDTHLSYRSVNSQGEGFVLQSQVQWRDDLAAQLSLRTPLVIEDYLAQLEDGDPSQIDPAEFLHIPFETRLRVPAIDLARIPLENLQENRLAGRADLDFELGGTLADPEGFIDFDVQDAGFQQFQNIDFELDADIRDQHVHFYRMEMDWNDDDLFSGRGRLPLPLVPLLAGEPIDDIPFDFNWTFHDLPVSHLSVIDYELARVPGYIAASIDLSGSLRAPEFEAQAGLFETDLGDGTVGNVGLQVAGGDDVVTLDGGLWTDDEDLLSIDGRAPILLDVVALSMGEPWQADGDLDLRVAADDLDLGEVIPTRLVSDFIVDPEGFLSIGIGATGSWEEPVLDGDIKWEDGAVTLPEFARGFDDIQAHIGIDDEQFDIHQLYANDGYGFIEASGHVDHEYFLPQAIDLQAEADTFNLVGFGTDFPLFISARTSVFGELIGDPGQLNVAISDLEVLLTDDWDRALHDTALDPDIIIIDGDRRDFFAELFDEEVADVPFLNLEINITIARNAWARHPMGDVNFEADLVATIAGTSVSLTGAVDLRRGHLEFLGRRFDIRPSEITFTGNIPPDPRLRLEAHHPLDRVITDALGQPSEGEARIVFNISGTAMSPRLELQSDPAMTDTEILFVLMTGRPPDRSDVGRDEGVASQALSAVSGLFFGMLQDSFAGAVPVDVLRLEPAVAGSRGGRLEVGSYLTNDIFFSWRHNFGSDDDLADNVWRLEYHFLPRWMIELLYTDLNEGELNLFWDAL